MTQQRLELHLALAARFSSGSSLVILIFVHHYSDDQVEVGADMRNMMPSLWLPDKHSVEKKIV